jgi:hypothetical protein
MMIRALNSLTRRQIHQRDGFQLVAHAYEDIAHGTQRQIPGIGKPPRDLLRFSANALSQFSAGEVSLALKTAEYLQHGLMDIGSEARLEIGELAIRNAPAA